MRPLCLPFLPVVAALALFGHAAPRLHAQAADYIGDTHVYDTPAKGEVEPEYWFDYGRRRDVKKNFSRHFAMLEYGITERWMAELRGVVGRESGESLRFEQAELETRWRFGEKGSSFVDLAGFLELEIEHEDDEDEWAIQPGVILSRDFGPLNLTANLKVLLCCSEASLQSWWVDKEIQKALMKEETLWKERGRETLAIIPLNLDGHLFSSAWKAKQDWKEQHLTTRLAADFTGWEKDNAKFDEQFERLVKALRADAAARERPPKGKL